MAKKSKQEIKDENRLLVETIGPDEILDWPTVGTSLTEAPLKYNKKLDMVATVYPKKISLYFNRDETGIKDPYPAYFEECIQIDR